MIAMKNLKAKIMKSNTIKISNEANTRIKTLMAKKSMNFSEVIEFLAMMIPMAPTPETSKLEAKLASIQATAFYIAEYTQEAKEEDSIPIAYCDYVMDGIRMIEDTLEDLHRE